MTDASPADPTEMNPFRDLGGEAGVRALVDDFYDRMHTDRQQHLSSGRCTLKT